MRQTKKQAKRGGEFGANGDWYLGGQFIATVENFTGGLQKKGASQDARAAAAAREMAQNVRERSFLEWRKPRDFAFAALIVDLECSNSSFFRDMGNLLRCHASLSIRQAEIVSRKFPSFSADHLSQQAPES